LRTNWALVIGGVTWAVGSIFIALMALPVLFVLGMLSNPMLARGYRYRALWFGVLAIPLWNIFRAKRNRSYGKVVRRWSTVGWTTAIQAAVLITSLGLTVGATTKPPPVSGLHRYDFASPLRAVVILGLLSLALSFVTFAPTGARLWATLSRMVAVGTVFAFTLPLTAMQSCSDPVYTEVIDPLPPGLIVVSNKETVEGRSTGTTASRTLIGSGEVSGSDLVKLVADHYRSVGWPLEVYSDDYAAGVLDGWHLDISLSNALDPRLGSETVTLIWDRQKFPLLCD
jgi:hypothetical protein